MRVHLYILWRRYIFNCITLSLQQRFTKKYGYLLENLMKYACHGTEILCTHSLLL